MLVRVLGGIDAVNEWVGKTITYFPLAIAAIFLFEVISRYFFGTTNYWVMETGIFIFIAYAFLAGGYVFLHKRHIVMDFFSTRFPPKVSLAIDMLTFLCVLGFVGLLLWQSVEMAWWSWQVQERTLSMWEPVLYPVKIAMAIGFFLFLLQGLAGFIRTLTAFFGRAS